MIGLSVAWLRSKGLKLSKRRFMVRKNLEQRAQRNRALLGALIPRSVQIKMEETLSRGEPVKAWNLPHITMLCIKFTPSVSELSLDPATAQNAFELLDGLISALDAAVDSYGMYKYQHVNDTYLVSCPRGALPDIDEEHEPYPEEYTIQMALLAFRIKEIVSTFYTHAGERLSVQVGLNCGPAAGAVVGESRRFYCIYGDILNTASRFCSSAGPGEVVCSDMFYQRVPRHAWSLIHVGARPSVELKGKGRMKVFLLTTGAETHRHPFFVHERSVLATIRPLRGWVPFVL
ncbi:nucleotide cyclase [Baffinella frigidus]|nr:nucleotide cyclase [Cryptophyta sp. CCMP2293]